MSLNPVCNFGIQYKENMKALNHMIKTPNCGNKRTWGTTQDYTSAGTQIEGKEHRFYVYSACYSHSNVIILQQQA